MKLSTLAVLLVSFIIGCSDSIDPNYNTYFDSLTNLDARAAIALGNEWHFSAPNIRTYVTTHEVIIEFPDGRVVKKSLPADSFYVAIAPYINETHTCETHYPSSCNGEIKEKTLDVTAADEIGSVFYNGYINTLKNGFFELWLPRNKNIKVIVRYNSQAGSETIPTRDDSRTCITTIKLH